MANKFNKGDVVVLKSGGMPMTIALCPGDFNAGATSPLKDYKCVWHRGATHEQHNYGEDVLEKFVPPAKPAKK